MQARVAEAFAPVATVQLHYRVMFGVESLLPMNDAGTSGDPVAGDGLWTAMIPASAAAPGQMIRYYVTATDTEGHTSRWPLYPDPLNSEAYLGTVVADPAIQSALPVVHLFLENPGAADTFSGTRASLFHGNELYDNVLISLHGQSSSGFPKKSYNLDFTADHRLRYRPGATRVKDIKLMSNWGDKARVRNALTYDLLAEAGSLGHFSFQVRVQRNAQFFSIADMMEDGDDRWLERLGRDPRGALYKMYNNLGNAGGNEKKTRRWEDSSDLQTLINNLDESRPLSQRAVYAWDHLDLPQTISYFVGMALCSSQDHGHKNYYVYCDNDGSEEWAILPWDVDLTWGRNWLDAQGYFTDTMFQNNVLDFYNTAQQNKPSNRLYQLIFQHPEFRAMVLRRLRTVMDTVLQPPGTPAGDLRIEARLREMLDAMDPPGMASSDADLDYARWGSWGNGNAMRAEGNRILSTHLPGRRTFLFTQNPQLNGQGIPSSQPAEATLQFARIESNPVSGNQAEEFLELTNASPYAIDLSAWRIEGAVRHSFRPGTVVPAGRSLYLSPDVRAFRARGTGPGGGQGLLVQGNYAGQLNAWGEAVTLVDAAGQPKASQSYPGDPSPAQRYLRITEIFYHPDPVPGLDYDAQSFEYLELQNTGPVPLDLAGVRLTLGVQFDFTGSAITVLEPGASMLVVRDVAAFTARFGPMATIAGPFEGVLDNAGETLRLEDAVGEKILEFAYQNTWYPITDGLGFALVVRDATAAWVQWDRKANWRPGTQPGGSPGVVDPPPLPPMQIVVNELLAHTDPPQVDAVELWNPGPNDADLSGWYLTDDFFMPKKYRLPAATLLRAGAYRVFTETDFNPQPGSAPSFAFSSLSEEVFLFGGDGHGNLIGTYHGFEFGASPNGVAFGRHLDSQGREHFVLTSAVTLGAENAPPLVGPVVISEIMYHPPDLGDPDEALHEYLELRNLSATHVPLHSTEQPAHTWRLRQAVDFDFPPGTTLPPGGTLLVVGFDPADPELSSAFRTRYQLGPGTPLFGPWLGRLDNAGETIDLLRPDSPEPDTVPFIGVDRVAYRDEAPWPSAADGLGSSLQRQPLDAFGNDPAHWFASPPTPGADNTINRPPQVALTHPTSGTVFQRPIDIQLAANATDPDGRITRVEFFAGALKLGEVWTAPYRFDWLDAPAGQYRLIARAHDDRLGFTESNTIDIEVRSQPPEVMLIAPAAGARVGVGLELSLVAEASDPDGVVVQVEFLANGEWLGLVVQPPFVLPWTPPQAGVFELESIATDDTGVARGSPVHAVTAVPALQQRRVLIPAGATWQYRDNGIYPGPEWTSPAYDATPWKLGPAELGYGDGDESTVVSFGPNSANKQITTWFRHPFMVNSTATITSAELRIVRDDGVLVYLDEVEVFRDNLPPGPILPSTTALVAISGADESAWQLRSIPMELLAPGGHVLTVEVHQVNATSSDVSFDAELAVVETIFGPTLTAVALSADGVSLTLRFEAAAGQSYSIQTAPTLAHQDWVESSRVAAAAASRTVTFEVQVGPDTERFYRVQLD